MKLSKKIIAVILAVVVCVSAFVVVSVAKDGLVFDTNYTSDGIKNISYFKNGNVLYIYPHISVSSRVDESSLPVSYKDVTKIYIESDLVEISGVFNDMPNLKEVYINGDVEFIKNSFNNCPELGLVRFEGELREIVFRYRGYYENSFNNLNENGVAWLGYENPLEIGEISIKESFQNTTICYNEICFNTSDFKVSNGKTGVNLTWENPSGKLCKIYRLTPEQYEGYSLSDHYECCMGSGACEYIRYFTTYLDSVYVESYVDETVESGETYYYYNNDEIVGITYLSKPVVTSCVSSGSNKATIKWQKVEGAEGYYVYQSTTGKSGSWKKIGNLSGDKLSCTATGLKTNTKYYFCVKAYSGKDVSYGTTKTVTVGVPTILSAKKSGESITLKWAQQSNTVYYRIYAKAPGDAEYTKVATITNPKTTSYTFKQLSAQGTQIKVRAFYKSGSSTIYSTTPIYTVK